MQRNPGVLVVAAGLACAVAHAQEYQWVGGFGTNWSDPRNWSPQGVPGQEPLIGVDVLIPANSPDAWLNTPVQVGRITAEDFLRIQHNFLILSDSTMTGPGFGGGAVFAPEYILGGRLDLDGTGSWSKGKFFGAGPLAVMDGTLTIADSSVERSLNGTAMLVEVSAEVIQGANFGVNDDATIENFGTWRLRSTLQASPDPDCELINYEDLVHDVAGTHFLGLKLRQLSGEVRSEMGTFTLNGGGTYGGGTLRAMQGGTLELSGAGQPHIVGQVTATGDGVFKLTGSEIFVEQAGVLDVDMTAPGFAQITSNALITVPGTLRASAKLEWLQGQIGGTGVFEIAQGGKLEIKGSDHALRSRMHVIGEVAQTRRVDCDFGGWIDVDGIYTLYDSTIGLGPLPSQSERIEVRGELRAFPLNAAVIAIPVHIKDGGLLHVSPSEIDSDEDVWLGAGGTAEGDARIRVDGGTDAWVNLADEFEILSGGILRIQGDGAVFLGGSSPRLSAAGPCVVEAGAYLIFGGEAVLGGPSGVACEGRVECVAEFSLESAPLLVMPGGVFDSRLGFVHVGKDEAAPSLLYIEQGGKAQVGGMTVGVGAVIVSGELQVGGGFISEHDLDHAGRVQVNPGGLLRKVFATSEHISVSFTNAGLVRVEAGDLYIDGPFLDVNEQHYLTRGRYDVADGAKIHFGVPLTVLSGDSSLRGGSAGFPTTTIRSLSGGTLTASTYWAMNEGLQNQGTARSEGGRIDAGGQTIDNGGQEGVGVGVLEDVIDPERPGEGGFSCAALNNGGCVRPGGMDAAGPFRLTGDFNQFAAGVIEVELGGLDPIDGHDQVTVSGRASLGGTLDIALIGGFEPGVGDEVVVMTFATGEGTFDLVRSPLLSDGRRLRAVYDATSVRLVSTCGADLDGDGAADASDFFLYLDAFAVGDPLADVTGDGEIDSEDFFSYLDSFAQGGC
ncbi:MAG: hypothetical protein H6811_05470 [Phycisphaeraceae bacterium]|nr:hypothetical protein [Phycisphaeraceae bacterium]